MINRDGGRFLDFVGEHSSYEGDIQLMGKSPVLPLAGKTLSLKIKFRTVF